MKSKAVLGFSAFSSITDLEVSEADGICKDLVADETKKTHPRRESL